MNLKSTNATKISGQKLNNSAFFHLLYKFLIICFIVLSKGGALASADGENFSVYKEIYSNKSTKKAENTPQGEDVSLSFYKTGNDLQDKNIVNVDEKKQQKPTFVKYLLREPESDEVVIVVDQNSSNKPYSINFAPVLKIEQKGANSKVLVNKCCVEKSKKTPPVEKKVYASKKKPVLKKRRPTKSKKIVYIKPREEIEENQETTNQDEEIEIIENYYGIEDELQDENAENYYGTEEELQKLKKKHSQSDDAS